MDIREPHPLSRRRFLATAGALGAAAWIDPRRLAAQELSVVEKFRRGAATSAMAVEPLRGGLGLITGSGGNVVAFPGADGVLLVDSGIVGPRVAAEVAKLGDAPIRHVVNTHWHFDHTDANAWMRGRGATIIAHENTRARMSAATRVEGWKHTFPRAPEAALPTEVFADERTLQLNGSRVVLRHHGRGGHTDTDVSVHFAGPDVLVLGDLWWNGLYPFIDYSTGGSIGGMITATEESLANASAGTLIVPGHGPAGDRAQLSRYRDMLAAVRDRVAALKRQGRSLEQAVAAKPTAPFDSAFSGAVVDADSFTGLVYQGV